MSDYKGKLNRQFPAKISTTAFTSIYILHLVDKFGKMYGQKILDTIEEQMGTRWKPSRGMVYPLLREMEEEGYLKAWWDEPDKRSIRYYKITEEGAEHLEKMKIKYKSSFRDARKIVEITIDEIYDGNI
ncbi:PadR family transcriptional regulator [Halanaerobacter jeridensis]|uniref:DNA-binding PadR family transcriptional regulator n=1 Tax=Halanaerobacter jeridensis TaxID=706427 RepID=A0A939BNX6_9FIRM|nr:PadR family transcriptional regulator [Halanaerobacter jeridensis]MBM7555968.1 DNA-binding PadR family transcriptional regulator [Halanaerobacter jeridensis]